MLWTVTVGLSASVCENIACILNESKTPSFICAQNFKKLKPLFQRTFSLSDKSQIIRQEQVKKLLSSHPFPSSSLTWIGGSLFSTLKVFLCCVYLFIILNMLKHRYTEIKSFLTETSIWCEHALSIAMQKAAVVMKL